MKGKTLFYFKTKDKEKIKKLILDLNIDVFYLVIDNLKEEEKRFLEHEFFKFLEEEGNKKIEVLINKEESHYFVEKEDFLRLLVSFFEYLFLKYYDEEAKTINKFYYFFSNIKGKINNNLINILKNKLIKVIEINYIWNRKITKTTNLRGDTQ